MPTCTPGDTIAASTGRRTGIVHRVRSARLVGPRTVVETACGRTFAAPVVTRRGEFCRTCEARWEVPNAR